MIYDEKSEDITTYSNFSRDKIENGFSAVGLTIMLRKNLVTLINEFSLQNNNILKHLIDVDMLLHVTRSTFSQ